MSKIFKNTLDKHLGYVLNFQPSVLERIKRYDFSEEIVDYTVSIDEKNKDYELYEDELGDLSSRDINKKTTIPDRFIITEFGTLVLREHEDGTTKKDEIESFLELLSFDAKNLDITTPILRDNEIVILVAAASKIGGEEALNFASDRLKADSKFVQKVLKINKRNFANLTDENRDDQEIIELAMGWNKYALLEASSRLQNIPDMVQLQLEHGGDCWLLENLDPKFWKRKSFVMMAINNTLPNELAKYVIKIAEIYKDDIDVMQLLVKNDITNIKFASRQLIRSNDRFREIKYKVKAFENLRNGQIDLRQLDKALFTDEEFYDLVNNELEYCLREMERQREEIEVEGGIKNKLKGFVFSVKKKLDLEMLMGYISIANKEISIQEKRKRMQERREEFKEYIKSFFEKRKEDENYKTETAEGDLNV